MRACRARDNSPLVGHLNTAVALARTCSTYEQHRKRSEERLDDARDQAVKLAQSMPRQAPSKHQLRGLKSSLLNLTQKELFAQGARLQQQHVHACVPVLAWLSTF